MKEREQFLKDWKLYGDPVAAAEAMGLPLREALRWLREERERLARPGLEELLRRLLYLAAELKRRYEADEVPPAIILEVGAFLRGLSAFEAAYEALLTGAMEDEEGLSGVRTAGRPAPAAARKTKGGKG